jgi:polysaccharide export outer membrane protein
MKDKDKKIEQKEISFILSLFFICFFVCLPSFSQEELNPTPGDLAKVKLQAILTPPYVIGPGDQLSIIDRTLREIFGQIEQFNVTVSADGYISVPKPDGTQANILAAGSTLEELSKEVRESFGEVLKNPLVFVQILRYRPINIYIGGEVVKPGVYKIESTSVSEKGGSTSSSLNTFGLSLTEAIQLAGGLKPRANVKSIVVTRGSNFDKKEVDLLAVLTGKDTSQDIILQPGDAIYVPPAENTQDQAQNHVLLLGKIAYQEVPVNVIGEVKGGGNFSLSNDATIIDALGKAGGLSNVATLGKVKLSRYDEAGVYMTYYLNVKDLLLMGATFEQLSLRPNDTIEVLASKGKVTRKFFKDTANTTLALVIGATAQTFGQFAVQDNLLNRQLRGTRGAPLSTLPSTTSITVIGGQRVTAGENK